MDFSDYRQTYNKGELPDTGLPNEPISWFKSWLNDALNANIVEPYTFSLATCGADYLPSVRILLLREAIDNGIIFYTNYDSDKGQDLAENPNAEALFFWHDLERQVRIQGTVRKLDSAVSDAYFAKRPLESQLGAWVSNPQSGTIADRTAIEARLAKLTAHYQDKPIPRPDYWGGYELIATRVEFWQGRIGRLHDRIVYTQGVDGWQTTRLLP
ncbi:MAG: pyridoxamine 5'-phosphate oxidase [Moraxella sp.]|nr:pyridoxamine 5'-phosphate oxidase [Moraxella sp.]